VLILKLVQNIPHGFSFQQNKVYKYTSDKKNPEFTAYESTRLSVDNLNAVLM